MKRLSVTLIIFSLLLAALLCCAKNSETFNESGTASPEPTAEPTPLSILPANGRLGNLTGGEIFTEPAKYLVLKGEGDLFYAYDSCGELLSVFKGYGYYSGFYGENGIVGNYSLRLMQQMDDYRIFGQLMLKLVDGELIEFFDCYTGKTVQVKQQGLRIGEVGGVLPVDGKYLLLEAEYSYDVELHRYRSGYGRCVWLDEDGNITGEFDPAPFGQIKGVLGGKCILGIEPVYVGRDEGAFKTAVFSPSGELLYENIEPAAAAMFMQDARAYECALFLADYVYDAQDHLINASLERETDPNADPYDAEYNRMYSSIELENRTVIGDNSTNPYLSLIGLEASSEPIRIYVGVKDGAENWLFKIFNPALASDSKRSSIWG